MLVANRCPVILNIYPIIYIMEFDIFILPMNNDQTGSMPVSVATKNLRDVVDRVSVFRNQVRSEPVAGRRDSRTVPHTVRTVVKIRQSDLRFPPVVRGMRHGRENAATPSIVLSSDISCDIYHSI